MPVARRRKAQKGAAVVEFALASVVLLPLFYGTLALGLNLGRSVEAVQVSRDVAAMYSRGTDFSTPASQDMIRRLAAGRTLSSSGDAVVILSQVMNVKENDCRAGGFAAGCTNQGAVVFLNRITVGNASLRASSFGAPTGMNGQGNIAAGDYLTQSGARGNADLAARLLDAGVAQNQGEIAYVVEVWFDTPSMNPFGTVATGGVYATSIF